MRKVTNNLGARTDADVVEKAAGGNESNMGDKGLALDQLVLVVMRAMA